LGRQFPQNISEKKKKEKRESTSQFALIKTQAVCQVPFSFSHRVPFDVCKEPGTIIIDDEMKIIKWKLQKLCQQTNQLRKKILPAFLFLSRIS